MLGRKEVKQHSAVGRTKLQPLFVGAGPVSKNAPYPGGDSAAKRAGKRIQRGDTCFSTQHMASVVESMAKEVQKLPA